MQALTKDCTAEQRADLALAIAQHAHLKACEYCALALAEIAGDVAQPWSRQTLNALAHRCEQHDELAHLRDVLEPDAAAPTPPADDDKDGAE